MCRNRKQTLFVRVDEKEILCMLFRIDDMTDNVANAYLLKDIVVNKFFFTMTTY